MLLVGTKADRATPQELEFFTTEITQEFLAQAPGETGTFVVTSKDDTLAASRYLRIYKQIRRNVRGKKVLKTLKKESPTTGREDCIGLHWLLAGHVGSKSVR